MSVLSVRAVSATVEFVRRPFLRPLRLSSGVISEITEARAEVTVEAAGGRRAAGRGSIYLSDLWAWPDPAKSPAERDAAMRAYTEQVATGIRERTSGDGDAAHPLELGLRLHESVERDTDSLLPILARLVCASPLDAALHDAAGRALGRSAFAFYDDDYPIPSADRFCPRAGACAAAVRKMLRETPAPYLDATLVVGKGDDLEELTPWITQRGYHSFKLKVGGTDAEEDAARVSQVYRWARQAKGAKPPRLSVDSNCASPNAETVGCFLDILHERDADAYNALEYVEQPTGRDIHTHAFDWRTVNVKKPVLLDEGLTGFEELEIAEKQGWNAMAVKTCRGHSFSLTAAARAHQGGWTLAMMDLTNPGYAAIHSALFAAHLHGVTSIEMNAPQYTPAANDDFLPRLTPLLAPTDGRHHLPSPVPVGLGSDL